MRRKGVPVAPTHPLVGAHDGAPVRPVSPLADYASLSSTGPSIMAPLRPGRLKKGGPAAKAKPKGMSKSVAPAIPVPPQEPATPIQSQAPAMPVDPSMSQGLKTGGQPKLGSGARFAKLKSELASKPGVDNPGALAATIGRKKYGAKRMTALAAKGRKG